MKMEKGFIISLIFAGIIGLFALNNSEQVAVNLFFVTIEMSQAVVIFISAFSGAIIVAISGWVRDIKYKRQIKDLIKEKNELELEKDRLLNELKVKDGDMN